MTTRVSDLSSFSPGTLTPLSSDSTLQEGARTLSELQERQDRAMMQQINVQPGEMIPISSSMAFSTHAFVDMRISDYVFGEKEAIPVDVAMKRIEKLRKKHPEYFEPLEKMKEKVYGK
jgi:hypothetical protein